MPTSIRGIFIMLLVVVATVAFGLGPAAIPAQAAVDAEEDCIDDVGIWVGEGGSSVTGICYFHVTEASGICPGPADYYAIAVSDNDWYAVACVEDIGDSGDFVAIGSLAADCIILGGGIWEGSRVGLEGTCTYPAGTDVALDECGPGFDFVIYVADFRIAGEECVAPGSGSGGGSSSSGISNPGYGKFGGKIVNNGAGSAHLGGNKNGSLHYNAGTCASGCIFSPNLPGGAANSLPTDTVATLYVRIADGSNGSYNLCFDADDLASPVIYRYVGGAWVALPVFFSGGQVCVTASGDGAFALGGS